MKIKRVVMQGTFGHMIRRLILYMGYVVIAGLFITAAGCEDFEEPNIDDTYSTEMTYMVKPTCQVDGRWCSRDSDCCSGNCGPSSNSKKLGMCVTVTDTETGTDTDTDTNTDTDTVIDTDTEGYIDGCSLAILGATGNEPNNSIPVCCDATQSDQRDIDKVFNLLNTYRQQNGVPPLEYDMLLQDAVQGHCMHSVMHSFFSHYAPTSESDVIYTPWDRAEMCGTDAHGENLARGYDSPAAVMEGWKNSPGHNSNMLGSGYTHVGICKYATTWGQLFRIGP